MCQGLNSHDFHRIGNGHQPNSRGLYANYKDYLFFRWDELKSPKFQGVDRPTLARASGLTKVWWILRGEMTIVGGILYI